MKAYIIGLTCNDVSLSMAKECIEQAKKFNLQINFFNALTPQEADKLIDEENLFRYPKKLKHDTGGVKGCFASHYSLWKQCSQQSESFLILEHDAFMIRPLPENIETNFLDVCKLDSCNPFTQSYDKDVSKDNGNIIIDYNLSWGFKKKNAPYGGYFLGAWAYLLKPHAAKKIIDQIKKNGWVPADKQFGENLLKLQCTSSTIFRLHRRYNFSNIAELSLTRK